MSMNPNSPKNICTKRGAASVAARTRSFLSVEGANFKYKAIIRPPLYSSHEMHYHERKDPTYFWIARSVGGAG